MEEAINSAIKAMKYQLKLLDDVINTFERLQHAADHLDKLDGHRSKNVPKEAVQQSGADPTGPS